MDIKDAYMDVGGRVMQEQLPSDPVNNRHSCANGNPAPPSRHTGEYQYDVHGCPNVAVIWISKSDPVNNRHSRANGNPVFF